MTSTERVRNTILGKPVDRQPIYGWVGANIPEKINERWGSLLNFEDQYEFDLIHLFSGPPTFDGNRIEQVREEVGELTPDIFLEHPEFWLPADRDEDYASLKAEVDFYKNHNDRFCYVQTPGFLEQFNGVFGIQNHLMYLLLYHDELMEIYRMQKEWTKTYVDHCVKTGVDMIHISDDWGSQKDLMFSPALWWEMIYPNMKEVVDRAHQDGCLCSLHSDGCITKVVDGVAQLGLDLVHPWQENANMPYDLYLEKYADKFAIMGGINIQNALGIMNREDLEKDIRRVFKTLRGKRWVCCTTHFVQNHCTIADLEFAYDLIYQLARE